MKRSDFGPAGTVSLLMSVRLAIARLSGGVELGAACAWLAELRRNLGAKDAPSSRGTPLARASALCGACEHWTEVSSASATRLNSSHLRQHIKTSTLELDEFLFLVR